MAERIEKIRLDENSKVNEALLAKLAELQRELKRHGIGDRGDYRIEPALGGRLSERTTRLGSASKTPVWSKVPEVVR